MSNENKTLYHRPISVGLSPRGIFFALFLMTFFATSAFAQGSDLRVVVVDDSDGEPLIGATVEIYKYGGGDVTGEISDYDGSVELRGLLPKDTLRFSYVGYEVLEVLYMDIPRKYPDLKIRMQSSDAMLTEVVVSSPSKFDEKEESIASKVDVVTLKELENANAQTTADALEKVGNIAIQKSQAGGGSPIIRGFEANKVLIVIDGVRMNNAIYRNGHLQNIITIDNAMLERIEVIYGPAAVVYGSDALGGVLSLNTKDPKLLPPSDDRRNVLNNSAYVRYSSANMESTLHFDAISTGKEWGSVTSLTFSRFGDVMSGKRIPNWVNDSLAFPEHWLRDQHIAIINGDDIIVPEDDSTRFFLQRGTEYGESDIPGYMQFDVMQKIKYRPSLYNTHTFNIQLSTSSNIQRYDQLTELKNGKPKFSEWYYGPQTRFFAAHQVKLLRDSAKIMDRAIFTTSFQRINEDRVQRKRNSSQRGRNFEDVYVANFNADFKKALDEMEFHTLTYGLELSYNYVNSTADNFDIRKFQTFPTRLTRYGSDGNQMAMSAAYVNYKWDVRSKEDPSKPAVFHLLAGGRYTYYYVLSKYKPTTLLPDSPFTKMSIQEGSPTGAFGISITPKHRWVIKSSFSTGYRAPNVDDFSKIREKNGFVLVPNPSLKSEYALNTELNVTKTIGFGGEKENGKPVSRVILAGTVFRTHLIDAIVRNNFQLPNGDTLLVVDGDEARVVANVNAATANIMGYSLNMQIDLKDRLFFSMGYNDVWGNYIKGLDDPSITGPSPLSHIPPAYGHISLGYEWNVKKKDDKGKEQEWNRLRAELKFKFSAHKPVEEYDQSSGNADNLDLAVENYGTPAWQTLNFSMGYYFTPNFGLDFAVENITDLHYRTFASGLSAPGRNFVVALRGRF